MRRASGEAAGKATGKATGKAAGQTRWRNGIARRGGTYSYKISVDGQQIMKGGFRTYEAARTARIKALDAATGGAYVAESRTTVAEYLDGWLELQRTQVRETTYRNYEAEVRLRIIPALGRVRLQKLSVDQLDDFLRALWDGGRGQAKMTRCRTVLSKALRDAHRKRRIADNPWPRVTIPKPVAAATAAATAAAESDDDADLPLTVWDRAQAATFIAGIDGERDRGLWVLYLRTGVRRGEALGLLWRDIDLGAPHADLDADLDAGEAGPEADWCDGWIKIRRQLNTYKQIAPTKTAGSEREFALDPGTVRALRRHRREQLAERRRLGLGPVGPSTPVFTGVRGRRLTPNAISGRWRHLTRKVNRGLRAEGKAELPEIRLHDARHTSATLQLAAGMDPRGVAARLGHSVQMLMATYQKWLRDVDTEAALTLDRYLDGQARADAAKAAASAPGQAAQEWERRLDAYAAESRRALAALAELWAVVDRLAPPGADAAVDLLRSAETHRLARTSGPPSGPPSGLSPEGHGDQSTGPL